MSVNNRIQSLLEDIDKEVFDIKEGRDTLFQLNSLSYSEFIEKAYIVFLDREVDINTYISLMQEHNNWQKKKRESIVSRLWESKEIDGIKNRRKEVENTIWSSFLTDDVKKIEPVFKKSQYVISDLIGGSDDEFLRGLYHKLFLREPDTAGFNFNRAKLQKQRSRVRLIVDFYKSKERRKVQRKLKIKKFRIFLFYSFLQKWLPIEAIINGLRLNNFSNRLFLKASNAE